MPDVDSKAIKRLADILTEKNLSEIEYESGETRIRVTRQIGSVVTTPVQVPQEPQQESPVLQEPKKEEGEAVKSPMVGTVYLAPNPESEPFIRVGDKVEKDQTLMIVEAMKVMNPIKAPFAGTVVKILVHNAKPVEFGEPIVIVEKN